MKSFKIILIICLFAINGCTFRDKLWEPKYYKESFKSYFIDGERVVLIGENKKAYNGKENYHYIVLDNEIKNVFAIGVRSRDIEISVGYSEAKGPKIDSFFGIGFDKKNLLGDEIIFLHNAKFGDAKVGSGIGRIYKGLGITRYPASKETAKYVIINKLSSSKDLVIWERNTPFQKTGKALATPFAIAADIVLLPITLPLFVYQQVKESQTPHFCQGEFCGYDKLKSDNSSKKKSNF